jgi:hypothetical protein
MSRAPILNLRVDNNKVLRYNFHMLNDIGFSSTQIGHCHPKSERELGLFPEHVIIDRADWEKLMSKYYNNSEVARFGQWIGVTPDAEGKL